MILVVFYQNFEIDGKNCTFGLELLICEIVKVNLSQKLISVESLSSQKTISVES